jgi:hypothetical protein
MQRNLANSKERTKYKKINNSGTLSQSLGKNYDKSIKQRGGFIIGTIQAEDYWYYVDQGRNPGGFPPYKNDREGILHWVLTKIPKQPDIKDTSLAFLIARKIAKKGTKATKFASSVLTDKDLKELYESLAEKLAEDVANQMFE